MDYIQLGHTNLRVSRLAFGTWSFGCDWGAVPVDDGKAAIRKALDLGSTSSTPPRPTASGPRSGCSAKHCDPSSRRTARHWFWPPKAAFANRAINWSAIRAQPGSARVSGRSFRPLAGGPGWEQTGGLRPGARGAVLVTGTRAGTWQALGLKVETWGTL
jgi:hypothetical protein